MEIMSIFEWSINKKITMNSVLRKLPIGIQTFEDIRRDDYLYVDKTQR